MTDENDDNEPELDLGLSKAEMGKFTLALQAEKIYWAYPKRVGLPAAIKAIRKILAGGYDFTTLLRRTERYAKIRLQCDPGLAWTPHPATWYNQQRYDDAVMTWGPPEYDTETETETENDNDDEGKKPWEF